MSVLLADTSVAIPFVVASHRYHAAVISTVAKRDVHLAAHSAIETYSVLTRLPGDARHRPEDALALIERGFSSVIAPSIELAKTTVRILAGLNVAGGAAYDAVIALTAREIGATLATRDQRALGTYRLVGVAIEVMS